MTRTELEAARRLVMEAINRLQQANISMTHDFPTSSASDDLAALGIIRSQLSVAGALSNAAAAMIRT